MSRTLTKRRDNYRQELKNINKWSNIKLDQSKYSVISKYITKTNHNFNWEKVSILDFRKNYRKRNISEIIHIKE